MTDSLAHAGHNVARMPMGTGCQVHKHRAWVPLERHHVWPLGMGGPNTDANKVTVCANGHYSIHEVIDRLIKNNGSVPDVRHFSPKVRALALRGWTAAGKPTHGSGGE